MKKIITRLFLSGLLLSLLACGAQKKYAVSQVDLPDIFQLPDSVSQDLDSMLISRDQFFKDSILIGLIDTAILRNFELRISDKEMEINNALYKQSKSAFYPNVDLRLFTIERQWYSRNSRNAASKDWYDHKGKEPEKDLFLYRSDQYSGVILDWEVDIWGKLRNEKKSALALYEQSYVAKRALQTQLVATIAEDYYTLLMLDEQLNVAEKNYRFRDSTLTMINLLYNAGEVSALAVQRSQSQVFDAASLISKLKEERTIQENGLRLLVGQLPGEIERGIKLQVEDSTYEEVKELPLYLLQNRPDILVAKYELDAANAQVGVTNAQRWPNLNISLEGGIESLLPQNWFDIPGSLFGNVAGGLMNPVFNGRKLKTQFEVSKLQRDQSEIKLQRDVYAAVVDIKNTLSSLQRLEEQLVIANLQQTVSEKALTNSRMLFSSGYADYLEVITAQTEALDTELELVRAKANLLTMRIQLYRALGGGWK